MVLCRCPYCASTFQVSIPPESKLWERLPLDDDDLPFWVCLDCYRQGQPPLEADPAQAGGSDTSHRRGHV